MYVVNGSDGRCLVAVRLIVGVRYLERPLREVLLYIYIYIYIYQRIAPANSYMRPASLAITRAKS